MSVRTVVAAPERAEPVGNGTEPSAARVETAATPPAVDLLDDLLVEEVVIEDLSIDGMCGVY